MADIQPTDPKIARKIVDAIEHEFGVMAFGGPLGTLRNAVILRLEARISGALARHRAAGGGEDSGSLQRRLVCERNDAVTRAKAAERERDEAIKKRDEIATEAGRCITHAAWNADCPGCLEESAEAAERRVRVLEQRAERIEEVVIEQRRQLKIANEALREKNLELDAMHYVWCDGNCKSGQHRWCAGTVTADMLKRAERNLARLQARAALAGEDTRG